jgi:hypothetical protein
MSAYTTLEHLCLDYEHEYDVVYYDDDGSDGLGFPPRDDDPLLPLIQEQRRRPVEPDVEPFELPAAWAEERSQRFANTLPLDDYTTHYGEDERKFAELQEKAMFCSIFATLENLDMVSSIRRSRTALEAKHAVLHLRSFGWPIFVQAMRLLQTDMLNDNYPHAANYHITTVWSTSRELKQLARRLAEHTDVLAPYYSVKAQTREELYDYPLWSLRQLFTGALLFMTGYVKLPRRVDFAPQAEFIRQHRYDWHDDNDRALVHALAILDAEVLHLRLQWPRRARVPDRPSFSTIWHTPIGTELSFKLYATAVAQQAAALPVPENQSAFWHCIRESSPVLINRRRRIADLHLAETLLARNTVFQPPSVLDRLTESVLNIIYGLVK